MLLSISHSSHHSLNSSDRPFHPDIGRPRFFPGNVFLVREPSNRLECESQTSNDRISRLFFSLFVGAVGHFPFRQHAPTWLS